MWTAFVAKTFYSKNFISDIILIFKMSDLKRFKKYRTILKSFVTKLIYNIGIMLKNDITDLELLRLKELLINENLKQLI